MSSLRNAVARRPHKERSQTSSRQKWGLLEKHKDYTLRAQDYNAKRKKLDILSQKSRERHPDEFAFGMLSGGSAVQGKHGRRDEKEGRLSHEAVALLKTQDAGYLRTVAGRNRRELERVREEVGMDGIRGRKGSGKKVEFDESGEPVRKKRRISLSEDEADMEVDAAPETNGAPVGALSNIVMVEEETDLTSPKPQPKSKKQLERETSRLAQLKLDRKRRKRLEEVRKAKLEVLKKRQKEIFAAADQLELQRAKMANVVGGVNKNGVKFKVRERKR